MMKALDIHDKIIRAHLHDFYGYEVATLPLLSLADATLLPTADAVVLQVATEGTFAPLLLSQSLPLTLPF